MGTDKARLPAGSHFLVEDVAQKVMVAAGNVALIGPPQRYADLPLECLPDQRPGFGPISGIETALASGRGELNLIVACDMPQLQTVWLRELLAKAANTYSLCVAGRDATGALHPLCAVYKSSCLPFVARAIDEGRLKLLDLLAQLRSDFYYIDDTVLNLNKPEDWSSWHEHCCYSFERVKPV